MLFYHAKEFVDVSEYKNSNTLIYLSLRSYSLKRIINKRCARMGGGGGKRAGDVFNPFNE